LHASKQEKKTCEIFPNYRETLLKVVGTTVGLQLGAGDGLSVIDGKAVGRTLGTEGFQVGSGEMVGCPVGTTDGGNDNKLVGTTVGSQVGTSDCALEGAAVERVVDSAEGAGVIEGTNAVLCEVGTEDGHELG
jgi:hypothetical protein